MLEGQYRPSKFTQYQIHTLFIRCSSRKGIKTKIINYQKIFQSPTDLDLFPFLYNTLLLLSLRNGCSQFNAVQCITQNFPFGVSEHIAPLPGNPLGSRKLLAICVPGWELLKSFVYAAYQVGEHPSYNSHSYHLAQTKGLSSSYLTVSCLFFPLQLFLASG